MTGDEPRQLGSLELLWAVRDYQHPELKHQHKQVLTTLVAFRKKEAAENGSPTRFVINPSIQQLARAMCADPKTVRRSLHELQDWGVITVKMVAKGSRNLPNEYELVLPSTGVLPTAVVLPSLGEGYSHPREGDTPNGGRGVLPTTVVSADPSADPSADLSAGDRPTASERTGAVSRVTSRNASKTIRGTRIPADWTPSKATLKRFRDREGVDASVCVERFVNHWLTTTGRNATKLDWERTFINWVLEDISRGRLRSKASGVSIAARRDLTNWSPDDDQPRSRAAGIDLSKVPM